MILNGYVIIDINIIFSLKKDSGTREYEVALVKDQTGLCVREYTFSKRTINERNKLFTDCS